MARLLGNLEVSNLLVSPSPSPLFRPTGRLQLVYLWSYALAACRNKAIKLKRSVPIFYILATFNLVSAWQVNLS